MGAARWQNNGDIRYGVRDATKIGIGKNAAAVALATSIERGFLKISRDSAFSLKTKECRRWILTAEPLNGDPATRQFMTGRKSENDHLSPSQNLKHGPVSGTVNLKLK